MGRGVYTTISWAAGCDISEKACVQVQADKRGRDKWVTERVAKAPKT